MPGLSGLALTTQQTIEILSLYSSSERSIPAVVAEPGWWVIGGFPMPTTATIRLDLLASVSDLTLTMTVLIYCTQEGFVGEVSGSRVQLSSVTDKQVFSGQFELVGGRTYQFRAQVTGNAGENFFGSIHRAAPAGI